MKRGLITLLFFIIGGIIISLYAQQPLTQDIVDAAKRLDSIPPDTVAPRVEEKKIVLADSLDVTLPEEEFKPNPTKAVIYSAILPGLGQIYNRKYWKLPLVYGGAIGLTYAITWNGSTYGDYKQAYSDLVNNVDNGSYMNYLKPGTSVDDYGRDAFRDRLKRQKDFYRRNRDLAIIVAVGIYALCMIDAYVDAQLYGFNISPDLSLNVYPVVWGPSPSSKVAVGLQCSVTF